VIGLYPRSSVVRERQRERERERGKQKFIKNLTLPVVRRMAWRKEKLERPSVALV
jgi:hypothetical protein